MPSDSKTVKKLLREENEALEHLHYCHAAFCAATNALKEAKYEYHSAVIARANAQDDEVIAALNPLSPPCERL